MKRKSQGSVIVTVFVAVAMAAIIASSVASLITFMRRQSIRQQLKLHSANTAETAIDLAYSYIINDAEQNGIDKSNYIPPVGGTPKDFPFSTTAMKFLQNQNGLPSTTGQANDSIGYKAINVRILPRPSTGPTRVYKSPTDPANANDPNRGQWVYQETIQLVAAVTANQGGIEYTSYAEKDINYNITNLFQHAIFYQGQLHLHRGFKVMGPVHTNGNLILNAHDGDHAIYNGSVGAGKCFYRGTIIDGGGTGANGYALVPELKTGELDSTKYSIKESGTGDGLTKNPLTEGDIPVYNYTDAKTGINWYYFVNQSTDSRQSNWPNLAQHFNGNLQDRSQNVPIINPIGSIGYNMDPINPISNGPYFLIEPLLPPGHGLRTADDSQKKNYRYNLSANASLVLRVEYVARKTDGGIIADPNTIVKTDPTTYYCPTSQYGFGATQTYPLKASQDPSRYIVRAYKKNAALARADDPNDKSQRIPIPFPTDVIGRADYRRSENGAAANYSYVDKADPQPIDILGTESGITVATAATSTATAGLISPARVISTDASQGSDTTNQANRVTEEAWHRYKIEPYYPVSSTTTVQGYTTTPVLGKAATKTTPKVDPVHILPGISPLDASRGIPAATSSTTLKTSYPLYGLHDSRMGRGAHLLTLDISRLKEIMEADITTVKAKFGAEALAFRQEFNNGKSEWNGIIYVEFPTSTTVLWSADTSKINKAPTKSVYSDNSTAPGDPTHIGDNGSYLDTFLFDYAPAEALYAPKGAETRYPLRASSTSTVARTDQIVPIAQDFRTYPSTVDSVTITDPANALLALQVINAKRLPRVNVTKFDANAGNALNAGFTLATNAPVYLVGSWNSDGDYTTGTNVTSTSPTAYATSDSGVMTDADTEIPSAIFCDTLTVLSPGWATQTNYPSAPNALTRRQNSFPGWTDTANSSEGNRKVTWKNSNERIEISACIATGDFPIFEFYTHALEWFPTTASTCTPVVVKGAMVSMYTSEIQHIKQAYGRDAAKDIQTYWQGHGANCFPSPRMHKFILDGNFPPGTPQALVPSESNFQILFKDGAGSQLVKDAGF